METVNSFFKIFDLYGQPVQLQFRLSSSFRTILGGIISFIVYFVFVVIFLYLFSDVNNKTNQTITTFFSRFLDPPRFEITSELNNVDIKNLPNRGFFFFAFSIADQRTNIFLDEDTINSYFYIETLLGLKNATVSQNINYPEKYYFTNCTKVISDHTLQTLGESSLYNAMCLNTTEVTVDGDFIKTIYQYLSIKFKKCSDSANYVKNMQNITCKTASAINDMVVNSDFRVYYSEHKINPGTHGDKVSPVEYVVLRYPIQLATSIYQKFDIYLSKFEFRSDEDIYIPGSNLFIQPVVSVNKIFKSISAGGSTYLAMYLRSEYFSKTYVRNYKTVIEFLAEIGGIWRVLLMIGGFIAVPINVKLMQVALANDVFNLIPPEKNISVQTYQHYLQLGTGTHAHKVIKLNNKTPLECKMAIDYYRFERNRGMFLTIKEALVNLVMFCCKPKEIEDKNRIYDEANKRLAIKLDSSFVLQFSKQVHYLKRVLLAQRAMLIKYSSRSVIYEDNLTMLKLRYDQYIQNKLLNSEDKALFKEYDFITGLRAIKAKFSLEEIDIDLIDFLKLKKKFIARYFLNHLNALRKPLEIEKKDEKFDDKD
jgi:hypothetical protein